MYIVIRYDSKRHSPPEGAKGIPACRQTGLWQIPVGEKCIPFG
jgi:hypothetical protein